MHRTGHGQLWLFELDEGRAVPATLREQRNLGRDQDSNKRRQKRNSPGPQEYWADWTLGAFDRPRARRLTDPAPQRRHPGHLLPRLGRAVGVSLARPRIRVAEVGQKIQMRISSG